MYENAKGLKEDREDFTATVFQLDCWRSSIGTIEELELWQKDIKRAAKFFPGALGAGLREARDPIEFMIAVRRIIRLVKTRPRSFYANPYLGRPAIPAETQNRI